MPTLVPTEQIRQLLTRLQKLGIGRGAPVKDMQFSLAQLGLLLCVQHTPGARVNELAQLLGVSMPTVSVGLHKLEESGWVRRESDPHDKRSSQVYLTTKAKAFVKLAEQFQRRQTAKFMSGLDADEQQQLVRLLDKAITRLEENDRKEKRLKPPKE